MPDVKLPVESEGISDEELIEAIAEDSDEQESQPEIPSELNILPLRDSVVVPMLIAPLSVGRPNSVQLIDDSVAGSQRVIGVIVQRDPDVDEPKESDLYTVGCAVIIRTLMKSSDSVRLVVQGISRFRIKEVVQSEPYIRAKVEVLESEPIPDEDKEEIEALRRSVASLFQQAVRLAPNLPEELGALTDSVQEPSVMADLIAAHIPFSVDEKQSILEIVGVKDRLRRLLELLGREVRVLELTSKVQSEVSAELSRSQREYYLREQLKTIQRELGEHDGLEDDIYELREAAMESGMSAEAMKATMKELDRLERINPSSPEYTVTRTYIDTMVALPWNKASDDHLDLKEARAILDADHYGLDKIKDRIIEFLAVRKFKKDGPVRQPILCFLGPPGVGKTSLGKSIARAMGREFVRLSLGGVRDEAEIRGHRRTYIGSLPGQIIQSIRRAGTNNPVFVLDEIDKLGSDFRGDPASAMLEVLDPQQNNTFRDHYLDVSYDLSNVFFITTANRLDTIPPALRDRMEIIVLGGYTEEEKVEIAQQHLIPRQIEEHGLTPSKINFKEGSIPYLIRGYTREAGVRNLEREIGSVVRKATLQFAEGRTRKLTVGRSFIQESLGAPRFKADEISERKLIPGVAVGLAYTPAGGDVMFIETTCYPGRGLKITGKLGEVMKESVAAAFSYVKANATSLKLDPKMFAEMEVHVHVPAGAVPKDGPSAGVTMVTALASLLSRRRVKQRLAMTGEVTLTGQVLPVGGIKEKVLAAYRAGVRTLILPKENQKDYKEDIPEEIRGQLEVHFVNSVKQVLKLALEPEN